MEDKWISNNHVTGILNMHHHQRTQNNEQEAPFHALYDANIWTDSTLSNGKDCEETQVHS